jgi:hypothetical protein
MIGFKFLIFFLVMISSQFSFAQLVNTLWYNEPAECFEESLVLGNGKNGATIFGGVKSDQVYLNDITLWSGEPVDPYMNPNAYKYIPEKRKALIQEDYAQAELLNKNIQGKFSQSYVLLGGMCIEFQHQDDYRNYHRQLDISKAIAKVSYNVDDVYFEREYFFSYPDKVMVIKLLGSKKRSLNFTVNFKSLLKYSTSKSDNTLKLSGYAPCYVTPDYWYDDNPVRFDQNINYSGGGGTYPNLFDAHPPFQMDGNFGGVAGIIEMLMQSGEDGIILLPALPDAWPSGSIEGICARNGFEISIFWKDKTLQSVKVLSKLGNSCTLNYKGRETLFKTEKGNSYELNAKLEFKQESK